jgi:hypothetical protein
LHSDSNADAGKAFTFAGKTVSLRHSPKFAGDLDAFLCLGPKSIQFCMSYRPHVRLADAPSSFDALEAQAALVGGGGRSLNHVFRWITGS